MPESVAALWRYPVKSMLGEELEAAEVTERGLSGDRGYALVDLLTGKVASAKYPRKWSRLFEFQAAYDEPPQRGRPLPPIRITLPNGDQITSEHPNINQSLSDALGRDVLLMSSAPQDATYEEYWAEIEGMPYQGVVTEEPLGGAMPDTFFDGGVIHVLTTATLNRLHEAYPDGEFAVQRFRPNIVIANDDAQGFTESAWLDRTLAIGDEVRLEVVGPCIRCVMTTLAQGDLPADPDILRTVARQNRVPFSGYGALPAVGVYVSVVQGGNIRRGDLVRFV